SPIAANTQRVQGLVGVDDNRDDLFNFSRVFLNNSDIDGVVRYGEVSNTIDVTHESMGANITMTARRVSDNVIVDQFVTGADGNFYFDLVPDEYIISIDDPLGRTALDDSITPAGLLQDYQSEWRISTDFFKVWEYDTNLDVPVDGSGTPLAWLDGNGQETVNGMKQINFLLDPGAPPLQQVDFSGMVFADTNGDGLFNPDDVAVPEISVFADENRNGQFDAGELVVNTDINGQYTLTVPSTFSTVMNVGVIPPVDWTATNPASSWQNFFVEPGDTFSNVDFAIMPPAVSSGDGTSLPGILLGVVFNDVNGDSIRQASESGVSGLRVYIDANNTGVIDAGDTVTTTNVHGGYVFANVPAGDHIIRVEALAPNVQTLPLGNAPLLETLSGAGTISGLTFGVQNTDVIVANPSTLDYGDLPDRYGITTLFQDGARHVVGAFFLGQLIDTEEDGQPSDSATLDDTTDLADEDGIVFDPIQAGGSGRMLVTASRNGGYLSGWMDFNGDDDFDDVIGGVAERLVLTKVGGGLPETRTL
ncbi:MAG: SdrD B-like domain-containing protein, partial [Pirellulales bacterium]